MPPRFSLNTDLIVGVNAPLVFIGVVEVPTLVNKELSILVPVLI
jgi:hypothetical protein